MKSRRIVESRHVQAGGQLVITAHLPDGRIARVVGGKPARLLRSGAWHDGDVEEAMRLFLLHAKLNA